jgi:hypothetical protein
MCVVLFHLFTFYLFTIRQQRSSDAGWCPGPPPSISLRSVLLDRTPSYGDHNPLSLLSLDRLLVSACPLTKHLAGLLLFGYGFIWGVLHTVHGVVVYSMWMGLPALPVEALWCHTYRHWTVQQKVASSVVSQRWLWKWLTATSHTSSGPFCILAMSQSISPWQWIRPIW